MMIRLMIAFSVLVLSGVPAWAGRFSTAGFYAVDGSPPHSGELQSRVAVP